MYGYVIHMYAEQNRCANDNIVNNHNANDDDDDDDGDDGDHE